VPLHRPSSAILLVAAPAAALALGLLAWALGSPEIARWLWIPGTAAVLAALVFSAAARLRRGEFGLDIIAALAMAGALVIGEELAGVVIALMYAGGQALEAFAQERAAREMTALLGRVPRTAMVYRDGALSSLPIDEIVSGDRVLIRAGDVVPTDGIVAAGTAILDESALTGEPLPVERGAAAAVMSGVTNVGHGFDLTASARAADSTYAGIIRLVDSARGSKAPISRLADRYALGFLAATVLLMAAAWLASHDVRRALAVLVVATPCPLILAVPVAMVAGMSRAARAGILVKSAQALEILARARVLLADKTGTLTHGRARLLAVEPCGSRGADETLRIAASLAQASGHPANEAVVRAARERGLALATPRNVVETPGAGLQGQVGGNSVAIGRVDFVVARGRFDPPPAWQKSAAPGATHMAIGVDGIAAALLVLADVVRFDVAATLADLRRRGISRMVLVTGDRAGVAAEIAERLGLDAWIADATPAAKVEAVAAERRHGTTVMVGDGINDAAALARADVGVALGARGTAAASEAADVVILVDRFDRVAKAVETAQGTRAIALQSVFAGMALSAAGMIAAAAGYLPPIAGALAQEAIDVAVVLNALRALR
jgi:heavy metal translocating P-type ATPase